MTLADLLNKGGPVVLLLIGLSVLALALVLERSLHYLRMGRWSVRKDEELLQALRQRNLTVLNHYQQGPEAAVIQALITANKEGISDLSRVAMRVGSGELQRMQQRLNILSFIGSTAPLIGLFGTITGMIQAFMVIESAGGKVDAQALAGGIWEAMITTGVGLAIAVPTIFLLYLLEGMVEQRKNNMSRCASLMIERLPHREWLSELKTSAVDVTIREQACGV